MTVTVLVPKRRSGHWKTQPTTYSESLYLRRRDGMTGGYTPAMGSKGQVWLMLVGVLAVTTGCIKEELAELPDGPLPFAPSAGPIEDWTVQSIYLSLACPDGEPARMLLVAPTTSPTVLGDIAVIYHAGAFDYVASPDPASPFAGAHYASPSRLTSEWAAHEAFATLGMYPSTEAAQDGSLALALAEQNVPMLLPINCWGDLWHNIRGQADNDFPSDFFFRDGRAAAEWAYRLASEPGFAAALNVEFPLPIATNTHVVGLGSGSRAIAELMRIDNDLDGIGDFTPDSVLLDSPFDDLSGYFDDPAQSSATVTGLLRVAPDDDFGQGNLTKGSFSGLQLPERTGMAYSLADDTWPLSVYTDLADTLSATPTAWILSDPSPSHLSLNQTTPSQGADGLTSAEQAVQYILNGTL